jgi:hypothetical protein
VSAYRKPIRVIAERFAALLEPDPAAEAAPIARYGGERIANNGGGDK